jgi:hypothetical protein
MHYIVVTGIKLVNTSFIHQGSIWLACGPFESFWSQKWIRHDAR